MPAITMCNECEGTGKIAHSCASDNMDYIEYPCDNCGGSGVTTLDKYLVRLREIKMDPMKKYEVNKFYVGSNSVFNRNWGHPTLNKAIKHAQEVLDEQNQEEIFIVQIIKVVKRKQAPVEIVTVK